MPFRHKHPKRAHPQLESVTAIVAPPPAVPVLRAPVEILPPTRVVGRSPDSTDSSDSSQTSCPGGDGSGKCQTGVGSSTFTLPIVLGVVIPVVGAAILFIILQRRHVRKQREEDANDRHRSLDFGMGDVPQPGGKRNKKRGIAGLSFTQEKSARAQRQMSMDLGMSSPYLLPPELQESRESLHSLSRTIHNQEDPYRPIGQFQDGASIRSHKGFDAGSMYTGSSNAYSHAPSKLQESSSADLLSNAAKMSRSNSPMNMNSNASAFVPPPRTKSLSSKNQAIRSKEEEPPALPYPAEPEPAHIQMPSISGEASPASALPLSGQSHSAESSRDEGDATNAGHNIGLRHSTNFGSFMNEQDLDHAASKAVEEDPAASHHQSPPVGLPANPRPPRKESTNSAQLPHLAFEEEDYGDGFKVTPPSPTPEDMREHRYSMDVPPEEFVHAGLGAPGFDARRLSMGFRPLPPDAITEVDDPEVRANRIRSFYKEYFDETKPAPEGQYYEDYDENYLGDAAYYDPDHNNFVMPYAQPVTRRAMTPPPRGPPRHYGPPRGAHGSMGGMSMGGMGGMGGGFRGVPGPRAYSSASGGMPGPRAFSSASQRMPGGPRRPMPPPAALPTLPTPSKLRDDSFAIFNAADFAPPSSYRERVAGRSESPLGERRPYSPAVPSFVPTVSAFDDLSPMPSPHLLRKSGTFTALDFAPPRRFKDPDSMSDSGSIRSNRSGVSQMQLGAIRSGAYRVSRLPQDMVGTRDDLATSLKPQWGMRVGS